MKNRFFAILTYLLLWASPTATWSTEEAPVPQCTAEYLNGLEDDLQANKDMRRWSTDMLRPTCKLIDRSETIAGKVLSPLGGKWLWDQAVPGLDPKLASNLCRYIRKKGDSILTPEEDEQRLVTEIERCKKELPLKKP